MHKIVTTHGAEVGITDSVLFIKISPEGTFIEADEADAVGIAFNGTPYNLPGHQDIAGAETVVLVETTFEQVMQEKNAETAKLKANMDYIAMMADVDIETGVEAVEPKEEA